MKPLRIRQASPDDAAGIVRLFRRAFPAELLELTIYGCRGIRSFVERQIEVPHGSSDTVYLVAAEGNLLRGCAELRRSNDLLFLNYLAVAEQVRRRGIGRKLLTESATRLGTPATNSVGLHVLESNSPARAWYARMGFREVGHTDFVILDGALDGHGDYALAGYPQATATYKQFGFSEFSVRTGNGLFDVGMLGPHYFRLRGDSIRIEPRLPAILRRLDPRRRVLCLLSDEEPANKTLRLLKMTASLGDFQCSEY